MNDKATLEFCLSLDIATAAARIIYAAGLYESFIRGISQRFRFPSNDHISTTTKFSFHSDSELIVNSK